MTKLPRGKPSNYSFEFLNSGNEPKDEDDGIQQIGPTDLARAGIGTSCQWYDLLCSAERFQRLLPDYEREQCVIRCDIKICLLSQIGRMCSAVRLAI